MRLIAVPLSQDNIPAFQDRLLSWFHRSGRDFPWRSRSDAYAVLVAEKLLQQTAARNVVVRAYERLLHLYPTPQKLAQARVQEIEDIVRPLGFAYRAKDLHDMARGLVDRHNGEAPETLGDLLALPGVGDYTARAVLSFALGKDVPIVDTNVARFLYRLYGIPGPQPANPARNKGLIERAAQLVPSGRSRDYNLAVLDLCALVCRPANPNCPSCPVQPYCIYGSERDGQ